MCVCAGVWPMWCSDALISLSVALFLNSLSPGVLKLPDGKFFLGNSYTSYFSFLSHFFFFIFDCVLLIFAVIWMSGKTLMWSSAIILFFFQVNLFVMKKTKNIYNPHFHIFFNYLKLFLKVFIHLSPVYLTFMIGKDLINDFNTWRLLHCGRSVNILTYFKVLTSYEFHE